MQSTVSKNDELCYLSATEAITLFKTKSLSPLELLDAQIARAEIVEPKINAFSYERFEIARALAKQAELAYLKSPDKLGPLTGISVALKDETNMRGENTTQGSLLFKDNIDESDHPLVTRLIDAGAVIHARSNVPEFSSAVFTRNRLHGITRNPWNLDYSPGGSSGGAGASLAAGTSTLASGSDIAGSIRVPASLCGLVGLKPSYGRVPEGEAYYALDSYNHNGPMARTVEDCALMFQVINGPHPHDIASLRPKLEVPSRFDKIKDMRIACSFDLGFFNVAPVVRNNMNTACQALRDLGATVEEVDIPWKVTVGNAAKAHLGFRTGRDIAKRFSQGKEKMDDYSIEWAEMGLATSTEEYLQSISAAGEMYKDLGDILDDFEALICPSIATSGWPAEGKPQAFKLILDECMTWPFNMLGRCPVLSVPSGKAENGVPTGIQIVGRTYDDLTVLQIGANLQTHLKWQDNHPSL
ncbi:MAG: Asp-tRNA(Asn)/Glu-tRNA(Gln) amidotransferase A subunit family amidase [Planctomycetota bacterium]|jgi:Asp-tRNA(Asn)/Glu-tRNA(Gln) amidotransferase A subunit family amidase